MNYFFRPIPIPTDAPTTIAGIINCKNQCWNLDPIMNLISDDEHLAILKTTIGNLEMDDHIIWPMTKSGSYTVRSGYNFFDTISFSPTGTMAHSSHRINERVWLTLWNTNAPPKVKNFIWRALVQALPIFLNLFKRKISPSPLCPLCGSNTESVEHVILLCPGACCVWFASSFNYMVNPQAITKFDEWYDGIFTLAANDKKFRSECLTKISFLCWEIWKARCNLLYQAIPFEPAKIALHAELAAVEFQVGLCALARDSFSSLIDGLNKLGFAASALEAEAQAAILAFELASHLPSIHLIFESNSQVLINSLGAFFLALDSS